MIIKVKAILRSMSFWGQGYFRIKSVSVWTSITKRANRSTDFFRFQLTELGLITSRNFLER